MDLLSLIKDQIDALPDTIKSTTKIPFVLTHISRAEYYLNQAQLVLDDQFFNDSVYRANQAFEAILKEAYTFFSGKEAAKLNIYQIENYIIKNKLLNQRVIDLLKNYRTEWRNPSTHDYSLSFSQQEALIAVISVQMFIKVLLNQITAEIAYRSEKERYEKARPKKEIINKNKEYSLLENIAAICAAFAGETQNKKRINNQSYLEIEGALEAFIKNVNPEIDIESDIRSSSLPIRIKTRPDFFISLGKEMLILELKIGYKKEYEEDAIYRLINYLITLNPKIGLLFFLDPDEKEYVLEKQKRIIDNIEIEIGIVRPIISGNA
jgi:HEPN domain-containing protein